MVLAAEFPAIPSSAAKIASERRCAILVRSAEDQYCSTSAKNPKFARLCGWLASECGAKGLENVYLGEFDHAGQKVRGLGMRRAMPKDSEVRSTK